MTEMKHFKVRENGFTLAELLLAIVIMSILSGPLISWIVAANNAQEISYRNGVLRDNISIAEALREFAYDNKGFLPAPYTAANYKSAPVNIASATVTQYLARGTITSARYNDDGSAAQNVKFIEFISPKPVHNQSIVGSVSETVALTYDRAVLLQTQCPLLNACNATRPASSPTYSTVSWSAVSPDIQPVEISTLDIQQALWRDTWSRLNEVRSRIRSTFNSQVVSAPAGNTTNWFFRPNLPGSPNLGGATPATNQGCRDGWYQLNHVDVNVLSYYGFSPAAVYATTSWGGRIEYCRDFDPNNDGANVVPHIGALRLNRSVTSGGAPSGVLAENLIVII
jgi:prepilin-type N-terminal cleavage/methylation domain-containing protein